MHEAARVRVEGTRVGLERIAIELGLSRWTLVRWGKRFGWRRPAAPVKAGPDFFRSRRLGRPYGGDALGTARDLVLGSNLPADRIAARAGVSRATLYRWTKRGGWTRPRAVASGRRRYRPPYGSAIVAAARELYEGTELSVVFIAARAKATPERVAHWARSRADPPRDMPDPDDRVRRKRPRAPRRKIALRRPGPAGMVRGPCSLP
jgi:hypothetical protein